MPYDNSNERNNETIFSKRLKAGKLRTYFFDVRSTRSNDYFITLTESKKRFQDGGYDRHKIFLYKEDFNKFLKALSETIEYVKTDLMPDFDFDAFSHEQSEFNEQIVTDDHVVTPVQSEAIEESEEFPKTVTDFTANTNLGDVDKW
ncbi:MAG: DUF3276 family protein [Bacteroidetes bacterium]|nr:DUF3276 family protein [Bacteroidota bacterium]